ncbi:MAG: alanine racemase [Gammaproteobacteria bacterium]
MSWTSRALINSAALQHNLSIAKKNAPNSKILAVIKSNAYGHGITQIAKALNDADGYAVATIQEAIKVRELYPDKLLLVLQGFLNLEELKFFQQYNLHPVIHSLFQIELLETSNTVKLDNTTRYWIKVDTGMGRLGFSVSDYAVAITRLEKYLTDINNSNIILMSHFANADDLDDSKTSKQIDLFNQITSHYKYPKTLANSAGIMAWQESHFDWVRAGIMLYGVSPFKIHTDTEKLQTVMTLESRLIAINFHKKGDSIGYGGGWTCSDDMAIGVVSIGYGDGYPRHATIGTPVLVNGKKTTLVGRVSMDMICIDLSSIDNVTTGAIVTLWGEQLAIETVAEFSNTIAYELLCQVGKRVEFVYQ